jgi:hypothetical protein
MLGGCNCGRVRYRLSKPPLAAYICHCHLCQKRTGGPFSMSLVMPADALELLEGEPQSAERPLPSGGSNVAFTCADCHSRLYTRTAGGRTVNVRAGTLDETRDLRPIAQFWISSAQAWAIAPDILSYAEQPEDYTPMLRAWAQLVAEAPALVAGFGEVSPAGAP